MLNPVNMMNGKTLIRSVNEMTKSLNKVADTHRWRSVEENKRLKATKKVCEHCGCNEDEVTMTSFTRCAVCKNGLYRYGLNRNEQHELWKSQDGNCKMCDKPVTLFNGKGGRSGCVDHDHDTNRVRGILCSICNQQIEKFDSAWASRREEYLK